MVTFEQPKITLLFAEGERKIERRPVRMRPGQKKWENW